MSYMGLLIQQEMERNPDTFKLDTTFAGAEKAAKANRELTAKNAADGPKAPAWVEYDGLRAARFRLTEQVKQTGNYIFTMEDQVRGTKERVTALLKRKKEARAAGQIRDEESCSRQAQALEKEITNFESNAEAGRRNHKAAKAALAAFEQANGARLAALEKELDA